MVNIENVNIEFSKQAKTVMKHCADEDIENKILEWYIKHKLIISGSHVFEYLATTEVL
ncbi:MAG: hypothetical protein ACTSXD_08495 [Candidatus Heimdallarchaeaceae archaeon]